MVQIIEYYGARWKIEAGFNETKLEGLQPAIEAMMSARCFKSVSPVFSVKLLAND